MKKEMYFDYATIDQVRQLCIKEGWFTCGSVKAYERMLSSCKQHTTIAQIAGYIWLNSDEQFEESDIFHKLIALEKQAIRSSIATLEPEELEEVFELSNETICRDVTLNNVLYGIHEVHARTGDLTVITDIKNFKKVYAIMTASFAELYELSCYEDA